MPGYLGALTLLLLVAIVLVRVHLLRRCGVQAFKFGALDKTDFLIPPFALLYFYIVLGTAFGWPVPGHGLPRSELISWAGVLLCFAGLALVVLSVVWFGRSFRVGIDASAPGQLVTSGIFSVSRNPIYVAFAIVLAGEFLIALNWFEFLYLLGGIALFHRQVLREEDFLRQHYGGEYESYCARVPRYL